MNGKENHALWGTDESEPRLSSRGRTRSTPALIQRERLGCSGRDRATLKSASLEVGTDSHVINVALARQSCWKESLNGFLWPKMSILPTFPENGSPVPCTNWEFHGVLVDSVDSYWHTVDIRQRIN